jgi:ectoine hydroxylase-related dioxygenase (phytanoyl-CoA dioxygenase family)
MNFTDIEGYRETLKRDGVVLIPQLVSDETLASLQTATDALIGAPVAGHSSDYKYDGNSGRFSQSFRVWQLNPVFRRASHEGILPTVARALLETDSLSLFFDQILVKEPKTPAGTAWHTDGAYWPVRGTKIISLWVALDTIDKLSGRLVFARGSHLDGPEVRASSFSDIAFSTSAVPGDRSVESLLAWNMKRGDALAFGTKVLHGGGANHSTCERRRAYVVRYCGNDVVYDPRPGTTSDLHDANSVVGGALSPLTFPAV